jgi:hypothetical protein
MIVATVSPVHPLAGGRAGPSNFVATFCSVFSEVSSLKVPKFPASYRWNYPLHVACANLAHVLVLYLQWHLSYGEVLINSAHNAFIQIIHGMKLILPKLWKAVMAFWKRKPWSGRQWDVTLSCWKGIALHMSDITGQFVILPRGLPGCNL